MINTLLKVLSKQQFGFVTKEDLDTLEVEMPNLPLLIRCGCDRYVALACDVKAKMNYVEKAGDYVRDVSIPSRVIDNLSTQDNMSTEVKQAIKGLRAF